MRVLVFGADLARWLCSVSGGRLVPRRIVDGRYAGLYAVEEHELASAELEREAPAAAVALRRLEAVDLDPERAWPATD